MKLLEALNQIQFIMTDPHPPVLTTAGGLLASRLCNHPKLLKKSAGRTAFFITQDISFLKELNVPLRKDSAALYLQIKKDGTGKLIASDARYLYGFLCHILENMGDLEAAQFEKGKVFYPSFRWQRIVYDFFLTQEGRIQKGFHRDGYIQELARLGFTHVEVNGLAFPMALESGPKGETYPMFYTYCPALDQFVYSKLNKGVYPFYYLSQNLAYLKSNAEKAVQYGLIPGLLCFEPRSVPETFFQQYPMLRGARVDHPFRSFKPRYNMTIAHPRVLDHYAEMLQRLLEEVPQLQFLTVWTNDSGSGFEHTKSLYVGRNGGAYLIREWKEDSEIARVAGENALRFLSVLRDTGIRFNPKFRVLTRMESFYGEHDILWKGMGNGLDVEAASLISRGWEMPYAHPRYPESKSINGGTIYQSDFFKEEIKASQELTSKQSRSHFYFAAGPYAMFQPLLGIPYPRLTHRRLRMLHDKGVLYLAHIGGTQPPDLVPYNINHEVLRHFQYSLEDSIDKILAAKALHWAGPHNEDLLQIWNETEEAILGFPIVTPLYATMGFTWYRLWTRPLVPDFESIPEDRKAFYQDFMCTTPHNPNNVDLSRDVLFQLTTREKSEKDIKWIDESVFPPLDRAISIAAELVSKNEHRSYPIFYDTWVRLRALRCWFMTQRNVAAWIAHTHGYVQSKGNERKTHRHSLKEAILKEIENSRVLIELFGYGIEFMALSGLGETPLMYGANLVSLLEKRIGLMEQHIDDEPSIHPDYIFEKAGVPIQW